jgi:hypothetical protein
MPRLRSLGGGAIVITVLSACAGVRAVTTPPPSSLASGYRLYAADASPASPLRLYEASTGSVVRELPMGAPSPDWSRVYTISSASGKEILSAVDTRTGAVLRRMQVGAGYELPPANFRGDLGGLSPNGGWLVLQRQAAGGSDFLVIDTAMTTAAREIHLGGDFAFDGISNDGAHLFLIESLSLTQPGHYSVRLYDLRTGRLDPRIVVDKREDSSAAMSGTRIAGVFNPTGDWQFSLYDSEATGAFIHALNLSGGFAWCIDLPGPKSNRAAQRQWGLVEAPDGSALYAVNPALGLAAEVRMVGGPLDLTRTASFTPLTGKSAMPFGEAFLSHDRRTIFASAGQGLVAIDVASLGLRDRILKDARIATVVTSPDGAWIYASTPDGPRGPAVWQVDAGSGRSVESFSSASALTLYRVEAA